MTLTTCPPLDALVEEIADLRPLPPIAAQVLQIAEGNHFSAHVLAQAISSDPALTARVLRVANSSYFGFARRMTTVRDAVVLLGFRQIREIALAACAVGAFPARGPLDGTLFWRHSVAVGLIAESFARARRRHVDDAFTAGVLHNIGRLALAQALPAEFEVALGLARRNGVSLHEAQRSVFGYTDADLGGAMARRWDFPADLVEAIERHAVPLEPQHPGDTLRAYVSTARDAVSERGITDGLNIGPALSACSPSPAPPPFGLPSSDLDDFETVLTRASTFIEHSAAGV